MAKTYYAAINWNEIEDIIDKSTWEKLTEQFWLDTRIPLSNDLDDWRSLSDAEKEMVSHVLGGLTLLDTVQSESGMAQLKDAVRTPHEEAVLNNIAFMESVHAKSYSSIFSTLNTKAEIEKIFEKGLNHWKKFLKKDGYLAVSYESWFTNERPAEIEKWWVDAVPEIGTISHAISIMQKTGYIPVAAFALPESCWLDHYFIPQKARQEEFLKTHAGNKTVENMIAFMRREAELYLKYKQYYGYVFYIGKKM